MTIAAADRAVIARLERELRNFLTTVSTGPIAFEHLTITTRAIAACRTTCTVAVAALHVLAIAWLERKFRDLLTAVRTGPVALHHRALAKLTPIITEHMYSCA